MHLRYRAKIFAATFSIAAAGLLVLSSLMALSLRQHAYDRIQRALVNEARLAAELLSHRAAVSAPAELRQEAVALGRDIDARVTLIAADGRVIGDSSQDEAGLDHLENHGSRPEVIEARRRGIGVATRFSVTLGIDMLYVAAGVHHPSIATVRLALPLTDVQRQLRSIWRATLYALALSVLGAFIVAWIASALLVRRLNRLADGAQRYAAGDREALVADAQDDEIGAVARVLGQTVRQLGEQAASLARDRAQMEAILAGMTEGVIVVDGAGRLRLVNAAARRMLRLQGDVTGRHYLECIRHPALVKELAAARDRPRRQEPSTVREQSRVFVARSAPIAGDEMGGAILVLHDVTDLDRVNQVRRDFVANVSHELRTPLTAIRGYLEALIEEPESAERGAFLDIIDRHSARMERLVQDLLRLARIESGQEPTERIPCAMDEVFEDVVGDLRPHLDRKGHSVRISVDPSARIVSADPHALHDVLHNLLENAAIYAPAGGGITLKAAGDGDEIVITVEDEGPGIPTADLSRVFERFYRVDKARSRESGGTGLGLAIVKHLVERMEGTVTADNRAEGGAIFTIRLPLKRFTRT